MIILHILLSVITTYYTAAGSNLWHFDHGINIDKRRNLVADIINSRQKENVVLMSEDSGFSSSINEYRNPVILQKTSDVKNATLEMLIKIYEKILCRFCFYSYCQTIKKLQM